jgi:hypothetical protein
MRPAASIVVTRPHSRGNSPSSVKCRAIVKRSWARVATAGHGRTVRRPTSRPSGSSVPSSPGMGLCEAVSIQHGTTGGAGPLPRIRQSAPPGHRARRPLTLGRCQQRPWLPHLVIVSGRSCLGELVLVGHAHAQEHATWLSRRSCASKA